MIDLTTSGLEDYWGEVAPSAPFIVASMDAVEDWVVDRNGVVDADLNSLVTELPGMLAQVLEGGSQGQKAEFVADMVVVLAYLRSSKALRLIHWLETEFPGFDFLREARQLYEEGGVTGMDRVAYKLLMDRLRFASKTALLQTVFSPERLLAVRNAIEQNVNR